LGSTSIIDVRRTLMKLSTGAVVPTIPSSKPSVTKVASPTVPKAPSDTPTKSPSGIDLSAFLKNPAVQKLVAEFPEITDLFNKASQSGDLVSLLGNPVIAKFVQENPSVVSDFLNGPTGRTADAPNPAINAALASLAAPPPAGAKEGIFGANIFEGNT
jgi:hypothetical protein